METLYIHTKLGLGRVTAAIRVEAEDSTKAYVGLALCSPKDQFSRRKGRLIAEGRLKRGRTFFELTIDPKRSAKEQVQEALVRSVEHGHGGLPSWAFKSLAPVRIEKLDAILRGN